MLLPTLQDVATSYAPPLGSSLLGVSASAGADCSSTSGLAACGFPAVAATLRGISRLAAEAGNSCAGMHIRGGMQEGGIRRTAVRRSSGCRV